MCKEKFTEKYNKTITLALSRIFSIYFSGFSISFIMKLYYIQRGKKDVLKKTLSTDFAENMKVTFLSSGRLLSLLVTRFREPVYVMAKIISQCPYCGEQTLLPE